MGSRKQLNHGEKGDALVLNRAPKDNTFCSERPAYGKTNISRYRKRRKSSQVNKNSKLRGETANKKHSSEVRLIHLACEVLIDNSDLPLYSGLIISIDSPEASFKLKKLHSYHSYNQFSKIIFYHY